MSQPIWIYSGRIGDENPLEHGGAFIYVDALDVYCPEMDVVIVDEERDHLDRARLTMYRVLLEPCTFINGILSDNKYHPDKPAWFAKPESERANRPQDTTYLTNIAKTNDMTYEELAAAFCSEDLKLRARAWMMVGEYHGWENLDEQPTHLTLTTARRKFDALIKAQIT